MVKNKDKDSPSNYISLNVPDTMSSLGEASFILVDIYETNDTYVVEAEIPGISTEEIEIYMTGKNLIIRGIKDEKIKSSGNVNFYCMERSFGPFKRVVEIPSPIVSSHIKAEYLNGLLVITLPKAEERRQKKRKIKINFR